ELDAVGQVARGQLRLRPCEHEGARHVGRPGARTAADQSESGRVAERVPRSRHPAASALREGLGAGEGLLTSGTEAGEAPAPLPRRSRRRFDLTTPSLLGLPLAWLAVFFVLPILIVAAYSVDYYSLNTGPHRFSIGAWRSFVHDPVYLKLFWK